MNTRHVFTAVAVLVLASLFYSPAHSQSRTILIGHPACLTGKYAKIGRDAVAGIKACVDWVNQTRGGVRVNDQLLKLEYLARDCESDKDMVTRLMDRMMFKDKADVLFAPYSSELTSRGAPIAESHRRLYMVHGGANNTLFEQGYRFIVQTIGPASLYHRGILNMVQKLDPEADTLALLYKDDEFSLTVMRGTLQHARHLGFDVVYRQTYPEGATNLSPLLAEIGRLGPDLVLGGGHFRDGVIFCRQMSEMDFRPKAVSLLVAAASPDFYDQLGDKAEGVFCPSHWEHGVNFSEKMAQAEELPWIGPDQDEFVRLFQTHTADEQIPGYHPAEAGAQVLAYVMAVEQAGSLEPKKVRAALDELVFMSFYGRWDVDQTGLQVGHEMIEIQWQKAQRAIVWPEMARTASPVYPLIGSARE